MSRIVSLLRVIPGMISGIFIAIFLILAGIRMGYPYELEWVEGSMVDQSLRILQGMTFYSKPAFGFIPSSYTPFYFYVSSLFMQITGVGFFSARLVSVLATLGTFFLIYKLVNGHQKVGLPGFIAVGLYAATYRFSGAWMDLARVDSLFLFLILLGFFVQTQVKHSRAWIFACLFYVLAYYTKQSALPVVLTVAAFSLMITKGRSWRIWGLTFGVGLSIFILLDWTSAGWFSFYTLESLSYHAFASDQLYFFKQFGLNFYPLVYVILWFGIGFFRRWKKLPFEEIAGTLQNLSVSAGLVLASILVFMKVWTYDNGFLPACLGISLAAGWGIKSIFEKRQLFNSRPYLIQSITSLLLIWQFYLLIYNPIQQLPTQRDREAGQQFIQELKSLDGDVFVFNHGFYSTLAGKAPHYTSVALGDILGGSRSSFTDDYLWRRKIAEDLANQVLQTQAVENLVIDGSPDGWQPYYLVTNSNVIGSDAFVPVTGATSRPQFLLIKNPVMEGGAFPLGDLKYRALFTPSPEFDPDSAWILRGTADSIAIALSNKYSYSLKIKAQPTCASGTEPANLQVNVSWDQQPLGVLAFSSCAPQEFVFGIAQTAITGRMQKLTLEVRPYSGEDRGPSLLLNNGTGRILDLAWIR